MSLPEQLQQSGRLDPLVWKITSVAVIGSFFSQLDATVVNVSLSTLAVELHSSLTAIQWVTSGYLLALALMLPRPNTVTAYILQQIQLLTHRDRPGLAMQAST
jgi:MFS family permease